MRIAAHLALRLVSSVGAHTHREDFRSIERFCLFVGHGRNGHSMVGALLDAHPSMVIAHEFHTLQHLKPDLSEQELYYLLLSRAQWFARRNARWSGYKYAVPSQYKGEYTTLRVIGDKKGGGTSAALVRNPELLGALRELLSVPVNIIHVTRHSLDNISTLARKDRGGDVDKGIDLYFRLCEGVRRAREQTPNEHWLTLPLEEFIWNTQGYLAQTCNFLGIEAPDEYIRDCSDIVFDTPSLSREKIAFTSGQLSRIWREAKRFSFLDGYDSSDERP